MTESVQRVDRADHPDRCEASTAHGQCWIKKGEGQNHCLMHGRPVDKAKADNRLYRLQKYQGRLAELKNHESALSLRNEIGILRITLEEVFNKCESTVDLMVHSGKISRLIMDISKLVVDSKKLEAGLGRLLDRQVVLGMATGIVDIIAEVINDPDQLSKIAQGIELLLDQTILGVHMSTGD